MNIFDINADIYSVIDPKLDLKTAVYLSQCSKFLLELSAKSQTLIEFRSIDWSFYKYRNLEDIILHTQKKQLYRVFVYYFDIAIKNGIKSDYITYGIGKYKDIPTIRYLMRTPFFQPYIPEPTDVRFSDEYTQMYRAVLRIDNIDLFIEYVGADTLSTSKFNIESILNLESVNIYEYLISKYGKNVFYIREREYIYTYTDKTFDIWLEHYNIDIDNENTKIDVFKNITVPYKFETGVRIYNSLKNKIPFDLYSVLNDYKYIKTLGQHLYHIIKWMESDEIHQNELAKLYNPTPTVTIGVIFNLDNVDLFCWFEKYYSITDSDVIDLIKNKCTNIFKYLLSVSKIEMSEFYVNKFVTYQAYDLILWCIDTYPEYREIIRDNVEYKNDTFIIRLYHKLNLHGISLDSPNIIKNIFCLISDAGIIDWYFNSVPSANNNKHLIKKVIIDNISKVNVANLVAAIPRYIDGSDFIIDNLDIYLIIGYNRHRYGYSNYATTIEHIILFLLFDSLRFNIRSLIKFIESNPSLHLSHEYIQLVINKIVRINEQLHIKCAYTEPITSSLMFVDFLKIAQLQWKSR